MMWSRKIVRAANVAQQYVLKCSDKLVYKRLFSSSVLLCERYSGRRLSSKTVKELLENAEVEENIEPKSMDSVWLSSPYNRRREQGSYSRKPVGDPADWSIILFPGQGTQYVGMAKNAMSLKVVKDMFEAASEILKWDLAKLCFEGPKSELDRTDKAQPAILVSSLAALEVMKAKEPHRVEKCLATAGFSVGEYSALVFGGAVSFEDAIKLVMVRGAAMQMASELVPSGMMTVIMDSQSKLSVACHEAVRWCIDKGIEGPVCTVANYLYPHCKVIAGNKEALEFVEKNAKTYHLRRCKRLPVSGAFHTKLMKPAAELLQKEINKIEFQIPVIPVHSNIDGKRYSSGFHIGRLLCKQVVAPVKWEQTLHVLTEYKKDSAVPNIYECGPGKSLSTILRMVNNRAQCHSYDV